MSFASTNQNSELGVTNRYIAIIFDVPQSRVLIAYR